MKTISLQLPMILGATLAAGILSFSSCKREDVTIQKEVPKKGTTSLYAAKCSFKPCVIIAIKGHRVGTIDCIGSGICYLEQRLCFTDWVLCMDVVLPKCALVDCNNPWNYRDMFVNPIPRYKDFFKKYVVGTSRVDFVPIRVTSNIAVLQFYTEIQGTLSTKTLTLPAPFNLTKEVSQSLGLIGSTIPAGTYPVVFDEKGKTFNAIVSVK